MRLRSVKKQVYNEDLSNCFTAPGLAFAELTSKMTDFIDIRIVRPTIFQVYEDINDRSFHIR